MDIDGLLNRHTGHRPGGPEPDSSFEVTFLVGAHSVLHPVDRSFNSVCQSHLIKIQ